MSWKFLPVCTKKVWKRRFLKGKGANPLKGCKPNWTALWGSRKETFREVWNGLKNTRKSRTKERKGCKQGIDRFSKRTKVLVNIRDVRQSIYLQIDYYQITKSYFWFLDIKTTVKSISTVRFFDLRFSLQYAIDITELMTT